MTEWFYTTTSPMQVNFHTKKLYSKLYSTDLNFIYKYDNFAFWVTVRGVEGKVRTLGGKGVVNFL